MSSELYSVCKSFGPGNLSATHSFVSGVCAFIKVGIAFTLWPHPPSVAEKYTGSVLQICAAGLAVLPSAGLCNGPSVQKATWARENCRLLASWTAQHELRRVWTSASSCCMGRRQKTMSLVHLKPSYIICLLHSTSKHRTETITVTSVWSATVWGHTYRHIRTWSHLLTHTDARTHCLRTNTDSHQSHS